MPGRYTEISGIRSSFQISAGVPPQMSDRSGYPTRMKNRIKERMETTAETRHVIAEFGDAKLVRVGAKVCLEGGSMADRLDALEWAKINLPGVLIQSDAAMKRTTRGKTITEAQ